MALTILGQTTSKSRYANGITVPVTGTRDGALYVADYILAMAMEGKLFQTSSGTITTPLQFKAYDADQPDFVIDVPSGTTIIPVWIQVHEETSAGTINEVLAMVSSGLIGAGTSTALTIYSTRSSRANSSTCSGYGIYAGNGTAPATPLEFWRTGYAFADTSLGPLKVYEWNIRNNPPQVIVGPGALVVYASATTTQATGFVKAAWIELASTEI